MSASAWRESRFVQVEDENRKPVAGAAVTFLLPNQERLAANPQARSLTITTDSQGRAVARGLKPSRANGRDQLRSAPRIRGQRYRISQTNALSVARGGAAGGISAKLLIILAVAGGAAAAEEFAATRGSRLLLHVLHPLSLFLVHPPSEAPNENDSSATALACGLYAADSSIECPSAGYVASSTGVRMILGLVGA